MRNVTASEANRQLSELLKEVRRGESFLVTSHGEPVAELPTGRDRRRRHGFGYGPQSSNLGRHHPAVVGRAGARVLLSEDMHQGFVWAGVTVVNPFAPEAYAPLLAPYMR